MGGREETNVKGMSFSVFMCLVLVFIIRVAEVNLGNALTLHLELCTLM